MALLDLAAAKQHANVDADYTTDDVEMQFWVDAAVRVVEHLVGAVDVRDVTEVTTPTRGKVLALTTRPVTAMVSATDHATGETIDVSGWTVDGLPGLVYGAPAKRMQVTYLVGREFTPPTAAAAARIIFAHLWASQRGPSGRGGSARDEQLVSIRGYAIPHRAVELLRSDDEGAPVGIA